MNWWYWSRYLAWTCMCMTYKKQKLVTSQLGWYDVLPTALKIPWIWTCTSSTSATWVIWKNTVTATCVRNVTGCGNMLGCSTDMNRRCYLQVSWWRVPYSKDRIRPVRRRRHRRPRRKKIGITRIELPMTLRWCYSLQTRDDPRSWSGPATMYYTAFLCVQTFLPIPSPSALFRKVIPVRRWSPVCSI